MVLDDIKISKAIIEGYMDDLLNYTDMDVAIGDGGPPDSLQDTTLQKQDISRFV